jgi:hypothetical protein
VSSDEKNDTVISAPFTGKANEPNINYMDDKTQSLFYQSKRIYVYGKIKYLGWSRFRNSYRAYTYYKRNQKDILVFSVKELPDQPDDDKQVYNQPTNKSVYIFHLMNITQDNTAIVYDTVTADKEPCTIIL